MKPQVSGSIVAGSVRPAQSPVELSKATVQYSYPPLVDSGLLLKVAPVVAEIDEAILSERQIGIRIGTLLGTLRGEFDAYYEHLVATIANYKKPSQYQVEKTFTDFLQVRFKIGESRGREYMRLASREDIKGFDLPVSVLIELTRLEEETLTIFLEEYPVSELKTLPFKKVRQFVREANPDSRERKPENKKVISLAKKLAVDLKESFAAVKEEYPEVGSLPKELKNIIVEINEWSVAKKPKSKKAA